MLPNGYVYGYNVSTLQDELQPRVEGLCKAFSVYGSKKKSLNTVMILFLCILSSSAFFFQSLLSIRQDDKVVCPRTKEVFNFSQAEKVYIM